MKTIASLLVGIAIAVVSVQANATSVEFTAMKSMGSDVASIPTPLSDEQLAAVEGGTHLSAVIAILNLAAQYQQIGGLPYIPFNLAVANALQNAAGQVLLNSNAHFCTGAPGSC
jgi:hypothetical protein